MTLEEFHLGGIAQRLWRRGSAHRRAFGVLLLPLAAAAIGYAWLAVHTPDQLEMMVATDRPTSMQVDYVGGPVRARCIR